jgi:hypothetical protein
MVEDVLLHAHALCVASSVNTCWRQNHASRASSMLLICCAVLLASLPASLAAFVQHTQQQLAAGRTAAAGWDTPLLLLGKLMHSLLAAWLLSISSTPVLVPPVVRMLLPLVGGSYRRWQVPAPIRAVPAA